MTDGGTPRWIADAVRGVEVPGQLDEFAAAISSRHRNALRIRRDFDLANLPIDVRPVSWYRLGFQPTTDEMKPSRMWSFVTGEFYLQDAGSLLALAAATADTDRWSGALVCDLCAAPGGKASALLEALDDPVADQSGGFLLANEVIRSRIGALQWNLARTGSDRYAVSNRDPRELASLLPGVFDLVLVDAPCSGQALLGRGKQNRAALSAKQIDHSAARQRRILDAAVDLLRPGGTLVYSTCTFSLAENEHQIHRIVDHGPYQVVEQTGLEPYQSEPGCYRLWPHLHGCAGSFAASIRSQRESEQTPRSDLGRTRLDPPPVDLSKFMSIDQPMKIHPAGATIVGWPEDAPDWTSQIAVAGPELAHRTGQTWKPSHAAALRRVGRANARTAIELNEDQAQAFMRGEPVDSSVRGWHVVRFGQRPLGWAKGDGSKAKNHLPSAARLHGSPLIGGKV